MTKLKIILFISLTLNIALVISLVCFYKRDTENIYVVKNVRHITPSPEYTQVYADDNIDVAYYAVTSDKVLCQKGDILYTNIGSPLEVSDVDLEGFYVIDDNGVLVSGSSGSSLVNSEGQIVGYVSTRVTDNVVFCIFN